VESYLIEPVNSQNCFLRSITNTDLMFYSPPENILTTAMQELSRTTHQNIIEGIWDKWPGFVINNDEVSKHEFINHILRSSLSKWIGRHKLMTNTDGIVENIINSLDIDLDKKNRLFHLIQTKGVGRNLSPEALLNWCLRITQVSIKIIKCLEYTCWANKRGQVKTKRYRSSGTLNDKKIVNSVVVRENHIITKSYRVSLALNEIVEVVTYLDLEAISKSFCDHYFISNAGRVTNTRFPQSKYSVQNILTVVQKVSKIQLLTNHTPKDFQFEVCYSDHNNRIRSFFYDFY